jgi:hypothetical protein
MEFDDDYSSSELENYSIYSDDADYQDDISPYDGEMDSLLHPKRNFCIYSLSAPEYPTNNYPRHIRIQSN